MGFLRRDHAIDAACGIGCYFQIMHRHDLKITFLCRVFCGTPRRNARMGFLRRDHAVDAAFFAAFIFPVKTAPVPPL